MINHINQNDGGRDVKGCKPGTKIEAIKSSKNDSSGKSIPGTTQKNKLKGGNYHEHDRSHHSHRSVVIGLWRGRRLLLEKTTVRASVLFLTF